MPPNKHARLVISTMGEILNKEPKFESPLEVRTRTNEQELGELFPRVQSIYRDYGFDEGLWLSKTPQNLRVDAFFPLPGKGLYVEFDEFQHFSSWRARTFDYYPDGIELGFSVRQYKAWCDCFRVYADRYRFGKQTPEFTQQDGRCRQRAIYDAIKDLYIARILGCHIVYG